MFPFVIHSPNCALCCILLHNKKQDKRQFLQTPLINISAEKQTADSLRVGVQSPIVDKCPTFTQIFFLWTECKQKQSQSSILCYISLWCCCLKYLLSFAGLARNKEKNLHNSLKFSCMALHLQSQTVQSLIQRLQHV